MTSPNIDISPDMLRLIAEIDEFNGSWKVLKTLSPERLLSLKYVASIESIGSSTRIEGSALSDEEVEKLISSVSHGSFASRHEQEVAGYAQTLDLVNEHYADIALSENYIFQLHRDLLRHSSKDEKHRGKYKTQSNNVEAFNSAGKSVGTVFETVSPFDTPRRMQELLAWTNQTLSDRSLHPLIVVGIFTVSFLAIHPFQDGNGRLSRILTSLLLLRAGYSYVPYSSMESVIERNKEGYYLALRRTQISIGTQHENWLAWLRFFLTALKRQKDHLQVKLDTHKNSSWRHLHEASVSILAYVQEHGRITTKSAAALTGSGIPTTKSRLKRLVEDGHLVLSGKGRGLSTKNLNNI